MASLSYSFNFEATQQGERRVTMSLTSVSDEGDEVKTTVRFGTEDAFARDLRKALAHLDSQSLEKN